MLGNEATTNRAFRGVMYDVKVWNYALSQGEVIVEALGLLD